MGPRVSLVGVVVAVLCGVAWGSPQCSNKASCSTCSQTPDCMWCGRNFTTGRAGHTLPQCIHHTHDAAPQWREACGPSHVYEFSDSSKCECDSSAWGDSDDAGCRLNDTAPVCSGLGTCSCGSCLCNERSDYSENISGTFCECTNFLCEHFNGRVCGGPDRGQCVCNKCLCKPGWSGPACSCEDSRSQCINPMTGDICSGQGECVCNECKCYEGYLGQYCEDCPTCKGKCTTYKPCVQCQVFQTGDYTEDECLDKCANISTVVVDELGLNAEVRHCRFFDENDCRFLYSYTDSRMPVVYVQKTLECPPDPWGINLNPTAGGKSQASALPITCSISVTAALLLVIPFIRLV